MCSRFGLSALLSSFRRFLTTEKLLVALILGTDFEVVSYLSILRYESFTDAWDFGSYIQSVYTTIHGGVLLSTPNAFFYTGFPTTLLHSFLGVHFSPFLFALVPLFALFPAPETLLVLQTLVLSAGGIPVYWLARRRIGTEAAAVFLLVYLIYPPLLGLNLDDFHVESFLSTFMLFGVCLGIEGKWKLSALFFALAMTVIEEGGILVAFSIVFLTLYHRRQLTARMVVGAAGLLVACLAYSAAATYSRVFFGLDPSGFTMILNSANYSVLGASSTLQIPQAVLSSPGRALSALVFQAGAKIRWLSLIVGPAPFSLLFPEGFLMALPWLTGVFLSSYPGYYSIYSIQQSFIIFFLFPSAVLGLARLKPRNPKNLKVYLVLALFFGTSFAVVADFPSQVYGTSFNVTPHSLAIQNLVELVPPTASILTTSNIFPHVAQRFDAYVVPPPTLRSGYRAIATQILDVIRPQYILLDMGSPNGVVQSENTAILLNKINTSSYGAFAYDDKVILLKANYTALPEENDVQSVFNATNLVYDGHLVESQNDSSLYLPSGRSTQTMWFGPYIYLAPGAYDAYFTLRLDNALPATTPVISLDVSCGELVVLARTSLNGASFNGTNWTTFHLSFKISGLALFVQFRGLQPNSVVGIHLKDVEVVKT